MPRENPGKGEGFVTKELPFGICIYPLHPNKNADFNTFTKNRHLKTLL